MTDSSGAVTLTPRASNRKFLGTRVFWWLAGIVAAIILVSQLTRSNFESVKEGPDSSSFVTSPKGVAAFAELAKQYGYTVGRRTEPLSKLSFDFDARQQVVVVLGATLTKDEAEAVHRFVENGGHLIATVPAFTPWTEVFAPLSTESAFTLGETGLAESSLQGAVLPLTVQGTDVFPTEGIDRLRGEGTAVDAIASRQGRVIAIRQASGLGTVTLLSDATFLQNELLDRTANAAFALQLLRAGRPATEAFAGTVLFAEEHHGYGADLTPRGLPKKVKWFLLGLLGSVLVLMWSVSRRNGPPEHPDRELPPGRGAYVAALGYAVDHRTGQSAGQHAGQSAGQHAGQRAGQHGAAAPQHGTPTPQQTTPAPVKPTTPKE